ncbi:MAG: hypothetical protein HC824_16035 [Synechococcales cyanobacterium RM1_1_8]|nr:hypothetical protein [Synechococcales cyanobacterium RM1_1_8]
MPNPIRDLKQLPWSRAFQSAIAIVTGAVLLEWLVAQGAERSPVLASAAQLLFQSSFSTITLVASGAALGIATAELWCFQQRSGLSQPAIAWTLVGSLILALFVRWLLSLVFGSLLPPALLTEPSMVTVMGIVIGAFWRSWL